MTTASASIRFTERPDTQAQPPNCKRPLLCNQGSETKRGGIKTSATGRIASSAAKKAVGEWMEPHAAALKKGVQGEVKPSKNTGVPKEKSEQEKAMKELQKDIKALLG